MRFFNKVAIKITIFALSIFLLFSVTNSSLMLSSASAQDLGPHPLQRQSQCQNVGLFINSPSIHWLNQNLDETKIRGSSVVPNETETQDLIKLLATDAGGIYMSVGTERALIGAQLSRSSGIIWVDRDSEVVAYNYFTRGLMAISKNLQDYLYLRLDASYESILKRANEVLNKHFEIESELVMPLLSHKFPDWWTRVVRANSGWDGFDRKFDTKNVFIDSNYLKNPLHFEQIRQLILTQRVLIIQADLADTSLIVDTLKTFSEKNHIPLGILDLSNSWEEGYLGHEKTVHLIEKISAYSSQQKDQFKILFSYIKDRSNFLSNGQTTPWSYYQIQTQFNSTHSDQIWRSLQLMAQLVRGPEKYNTFRRFQQNWE